MFKKILLIVLFLASVFMMVPSYVNAITREDSRLVYGLAKKKNNNNNNNTGMTDTKKIDDIVDKYNQNQTCTGGDSILGDPGDPNSVAWLLQQILNIIKVVGPLLVVVLSSIDFAKVIIKSDDEAMAKAQKKLIIRLILAALLFFIPLLVEVMLDVFGFTSSATCGLQ